LGSCQDFGSLQIPRIVLGRQEGSLRAVEKLSTIIEGRLYNVPSGGNVQQEKQDFRGMKAVVPFGISIQSEVKLKLKQY